MKNFVVAEEVAAQEVKEFVEYHLDDEISIEQTKDDYSDVVKSVMLGNLNLSDKDSPVLKLRKPIKSEGGSFDVNEITFLTRLTKSQLAVLAKGIDLSKDRLAFANRLTAHACQLDAVSMLDLIGKHDMKVIDLLVGLFQ
jgi:hypothetical protein